MSWITDVWDSATFATDLSSVGAGVPAVYYNKTMMELLIQDLQLYRFAQLRPLPEGNGTTIELTRPLVLSPATTALTESINPDATQVDFQKVRAVLAEYGAWGQISSLVKQAHIDQDILGAVQTFGAQAAETMDLLLNFEVSANGNFPLAADEATTSTLASTLTTVTSTTSMADTVLAANTGYGDANDDCNQSIMIMTSGVAKGEARTVTDYVTSGGVITLTRGFDMTPAVGDSYTITTPDEITSGDDLSYVNLKSARTILKNERSRPFGGSGGRYACIISPDQWKNLADDTDWKLVQTHKDRTRGIEDGSAPEFAGFRFYEHTQPFAFPIETRGTAGTAGGPGNNGANYAAAGAVQTALCFGMNAFGASSFKKKGSQVMKPPVRVKYPNQFDKSDPLDRWCAVGWVIEAAMKSLYGLHCVGIWTST